MAVYLIVQESKKTLVGIVFFVLVYPLVFVAYSELECPNSCFCDDNGHFISCIGDGLWHMPRNVPTSVKRLELRNYIIPTLSSKDLEKLNDLLELTIYQSEIRYIENGTFVNLKKLQRLELSLNLIEKLNASIFVGLKELQYLDLSSNKLTSTEEALQNLKLVEKLNLRTNKLTTITSRSFNGLLEVQYLNLDSNTISNIEAGAFQHLTNLAHLILSNNPLTSLSRLNFFGSKLQYIDFSNVGLMHVPPSLTRFVRDLRLAKNNITLIGAGDFDSYPYLGLLVLDDNNITKIENDAFGRLEYLMRLSLNGNNIKKIPLNLPSSLRALYIEENHMKKLFSYSFRGLNLLEQLFLQRNDIIELEMCAFCDLVQLKNLDLQANRIQNLTNGVFANLTNLESLDLSQNKLKILGSRCFAGLTNLKILQLSRTSTSIEFDDSVFDTLKSLEILELYDSAPFSVEILNSTRALHGLRKLKELNIMHNKLVCLRSDLPSFFSAIKVIKMSGNKWHCDRSVLWLTKWLRTTSIQFYRSYDVKCSSPDQLEYKPIMLLTEKDFIITTTSSTDLRITTEYQNIKTPVNTVTRDQSVGRHYPYEHLIPVGIGTDSTKMITEETVPHHVASTVFTDYPPAFGDDKHKQKNISFNKLQINVSKHNLSATKSSNGSYMEYTLNKIVHLNVTSSYKSKTHLVKVLKTDTNEYNTTQSAYKGIIIKEKSRNVWMMKGKNDTAPTTAGNQKRFSTPKEFYLSSIATVHNLAHHHDKTLTILSSSLTGGCVLLIIVLLVSIAVFKYRKGSDAAACDVRKSSSSISYCPQRDEVSILTLSEGAVGLKTDTHHGLGNKLYYLMENGNISKDPTKDAIPDPQLQDLLSQLSGKNGEICINEHVVL
ncbi:slit homolog 2 protein-like [Limulus polyphemus]|uniref:Slit homolog 2 protein-like n=1 Tax=Limulus polyphemus TaxID=6850 RepID=A0ABM1TNX8_LIMPO|nr:slit homolog 2 protein-like [Limulus polyphemus]XP_022257584.1 slit homolog 2 protein-like [Limulus polyphemus]